MEPLRKQKKLVKLFTSNRQRSYHSKLLTDGHGIALRGRKHQSMPLSVILNVSGYW